jgi:Fuc2NAc and GlcNAc transferase
MSLIEAIIVFISAVCLIFLYKKVAIKKGIFAHISARSLHAKVVVRGGGIVFGVLFSLMMYFYLLKENVQVWETISFGLCGLFATLIGFFDDIYDINAKKKFLMQILLSISFTASFFYFNFSTTFFENNSILIFIIICSWVFLPLWIINSFNFIDGINGLAIGTAIFSATTLILSLYISKGSSNFITIYSLLLIVCLGFLPFNFPVAKLFMGDAGSIFLGFIFGSTVLVILFNNYLSIWTVISVFSYMLADTLSTNIIRLLTVKKWYGVHRSHAYQNLARVLNNHTKVTSGIMLYNTFYILPLTLFTLWYPDFAVYSAIAAILPAIIFSIKYGPLYSNK